MQVKSRWSGTTSGRRIRSATSRGILLVLVVSSPAVTHAETWTLERVLDAVRERDPGVRAARAQGDAGRALGATSYAALSPRWSAHAGAIRGDDPALLFTEKLRQGRFGSGDFALGVLNEPPATSALEWGVVLEQPLFNGGAEFTAPALAGHLRRAAGAAESAAISDALLGAVETYVAALRARRAVAADSLALAAAREGCRAATERFRMGQVSELDTLRAAARRAEAHVGWLESRRQEDIALAHLSGLVGADIGSGEVARVEPGATLEAEEAAGGAGGAALGRSSAAAAATRRGELLAARERAAVLALEARQAGLRLLPSLNAHLALDQYSDGFGRRSEWRWNAGLALEMSLWDGARRLEERSAARARARQSAAEVEVLGRDLAVAALDAAAEMRLASEGRAAARIGRDASNEALRLTLDRYRSGLLPFGDWLAASAEAERARARDLDAEARVTMTRYRYLHAIGALR